MLKEAGVAHAITVTGVNGTDMTVLCTLFNKARALNNSFPDAEYSLREFLDVVAGEQILVARIGSDIAGFAAVWTAETFLHHLYVSPRFQRQGVGRELLQHCVRRFGTPMSLKCMETNLEARRFYEKRGWRATETGDGPEGRYILYNVI